MIVKNNANQAGANGYCSIARAASNETGENCIYDFSYYINKGLIDKESLLEILYNKADAIGEDVSDEEDWTESDGTNCNGFYPRLRLLNAALDIEIERNNEYFLPLNQAKSDLTLAENGIEAATKGMETALADFETLAGFGFNPEAALATSPSYIYLPNGEDNAALNTDRANIVKNSDDLQKYLNAWLENKSSFDKFTQ
jgi:hypothetical protein